MDTTEQLNLSPLVHREIGIAIPDRTYGNWQTTLHEEDRNYNILGITRNICFAVDPEGNVWRENVCCSATDCAAAPYFDTWPPSAYPPDTPTETIEGTKILPDGYFSPGSHIEYFFRRSDAPQGTANVRFAPDTTRVTRQTTLYYSGDDCQRFLEMAVLPDLWKDLRFGGSGLACMLVIDAEDGGGQENVVIGALDTLGYGKNNGAGRGWKEISPANPNPDSPAGFVAPNLGQKGLTFDWFDTGPGTWPANRPGCRYTSRPSEFPEAQCTAGPSKEMLKHYYTTLVWMGGEEWCSALHDGLWCGEQSNDAELVIDFLSTANSASERAVWLAGNGAATSLLDASDITLDLFENYFAASYVTDNYRKTSGNRDTPTAVVNLQPGFQTTDAYGLHNDCYRSLDVIGVNTAVPGGQLIQRFEDQSDGDLSIYPGTYGAGVYRPADGISRYYTTLITTYQLPELLGVGFENTTTGFGRPTFIDDVLLEFNLCAAIGPVVAIGDLPGVSGAKLNLVRGAFPNPSLLGKATVQFNLAQPSPVSIRFYNVAGRLVHEARIDGVAGPNSYRWDGSTSTGLRAAAGVYFYRLSAPGVEFQGNNRRIVLLGHGGS
jgi:hypothetical protein